MSDETIPTVEVLAKQIRRLRIYLLVLIAAVLVVGFTRWPSGAPRTEQECMDRYRAALVDGKFGDEPSAQLARYECELLP